jgi:hypothetical protein
MKIDMKTVRLFCMVLIMEIPQVYPCNVEVYNNQGVPVRPKGS